MEPVLELVNRIFQKFLKFHSDYFHKKNNGSKTGLVTLLTLRRKESIN